MVNARWLDDRRKRAWAEGRARVDRLLAEYATNYRLEVPPPPALVAAELIRDVLRVQLFFDPMPLDRFAEVRLVGEQPCVTVNSEIGCMEGVKDPDGVANVAMLHEVMHIECDLPVLVAPASRQLPGFDEPPAIVCFRAAGRRTLGSDAIEREFWAEEAGRAAAVSTAILARTEPFQELVRLARTTRGPVKAGFPLLYDAAKAIGANISAVVKQLSLESLISVEDRQVYVQPALYGIGS